MNFDDVFKAHIPPAFREDCLDILARAVLTITKFTGKNWSLRVSANNGIMLKVGAHEVIQFVRSGAYFIVDTATIRDELRKEQIYVFSNGYDYKHKPTTIGFYPSNPGTEACDTKVENAKTLFDQITDSFVEAVKRAARTRPNPSNRKTHSREFVEYIKVRTGIAVPQPNYVDITYRPSAVDERLVEGAVQTRLVTIYGRDPKARKECLEYYGTTCYVCQMIMEQVYGDIGKNVIHVHHEIPISTQKESHSVNPIEDLKPVCPNCHAVLHSKAPPYSLEEVRQAFLSKRNGFAMKE
ncbi:MAG: hypothetical protein SFU83_02040 [Meiothermus sp.]|nr:hypothetical protein [Meiothermus sp.]